MSKIASICEQSKQRGNALVLLLLIKTWDGQEPPTRDELAALAHISPRQAERDLLKLIEDGEIEKVGRRGVFTHFQVRHLTDMSDESDNQMTDTSVEQLSDLSEAAPVSSDMSVESATSDIPLSDSSDTSVRCESGTEVAPLSAETTKQKKSQATPETAGESPAEVVDWSEIGRERSRMLDALKAIIGAIPNPQGERAACNWLLKNRAKLHATTDDFIECLREQEDDVKTGNWRRKVSWLIVKAEFPSWQLRAKSTEAKYDNGHGGRYGTDHGKRAHGTSLSDRNEAAIEDIYSRRAARRDAGGSA